MRLFKNIFSNLYFNYILLFIALLYSFVFIFFGIDFTDTFYYINLCKDYTSSPMIILTLLIGKGWMSLFGDSLISFRVLNWAIWILSILLPFIILIPSNFRRENLKYVSLSIFLMTILNFNVFGGDGCTLVFLALSTSLIIKYYQTGKLIHLLLYGLSSSLLILVRFPNILILPASVVIFSIIEYSKIFKILQKRKILISYFKKIGIYFVVNIGFYVLINLLVYGSISEFITKLTFSILNTDENHNLLSMVRGYVIDSIKIIQYIGVCFLIYTIVNNRLISNLSVQRALKISVFVFIILFLKIEIGIGKYNWNISLFYSAIVSSLLIFYSIFYIKREEYYRLVFISIIFIFAIIPATGSTTGLLKISPFLVAFLPILPASNQNVINKFSQLSYLFALFFLFVIYTKMTVVYEDSKITDLKYELKTGKLNHIRTTRVNVDFITDVLQEFEKNITDNKNVLFYGKVSHVFYYLTNTKPLYQNSFWMPPYDTKEIKKAEQIIVSKKPVVIFVPSYPENSAQYFNDRKTISPFETMLIKNGYIVSSKNSFIIYNP